MKDYEIVINDKSTVKRTYLKIARVGRILPAVLCVAVLICALAWFFFGKMTICVTGYCESSEKRAVLMLPMYCRTQINPGDTVWVGNHSGRIGYVYGESYFTYDDICNSEDIIFRNFLNSGRCDAGVSYIFGSARFQDSIAGMTEYRIVLDTVTPYQKLTGRMEHGR